MLEIIQSSLGTVLDAAIAATFALSGVYCAFTAAALMFRRHRPAEDGLPAGASWPQVTVQIPTYNELAALNCARCCLEFDYPADRYEIIVINDHSDDNTVELLQQMQARHPERRLIVISTDAAVGGTGKWRACLLRIFAGSKNILTSA